MSNVRKTRIRLLTATAAAAIAALSLTACGEGSGVRSEGSPASSPTAATDSRASSHNDARPPSAGSEREANAASVKTPGKADGRTIGTSGHGASSSGSGDDGMVTCDGSNTKTVAAPLQRPLNHMLLTVTNTGNEVCHLYNHPALRFGEAQSVPPVIASSRPQAVVTLAPGDSGYAAVSLSAADGSGSYGHTVHDLTVYFQGRAGEDTDSAHPSLPADGVYLDSTVKVTYWQQDLDDAIM